MSLSAKIREQLISSFRDDLTEQVQIMTDGLLALEQGRLAGADRRSMMEDVFRAAHSLKGAARTVGVTAVEQLAHGLEGVLDAMQHEAVEPTPELFDACYQALDALQVVQAAYEAGETTPPVQALQALVDLKPFLPSTSRQARSGASSRQVASPQEAEVAAETEGRQGEQEALLSHEGKEGDWPVLSGVAKGADETIRVSVSKLDALMAQLSELVMTRMRAEQRLTQVHQCQAFMALWQKEWLAIRSVYGRLARRNQEVNAALGLPGPSRWPEVPAQGAITPWRRGAWNDHEVVPVSAAGGNGLGWLAKDISLLIKYVGAGHERLHRVQVMVNELERQYANDMMHLSLAIDELESEVKGVRMLPLSTLTVAFGRMVRDLAQEAGKEAVLNVVGSETELDKHMLEQIKDPLIHLLRNAVDHGIESPEERVALGKPRRGHLTIAARQAGQEVVISVSDDGAGLDIEAIRQAVLRQGRTDVSSLGEAQVAELVFRLGVTTSAFVTDISGRGIGLDIVRRKVEALRGQVGVAWEKGGGTTFTLRLPLTLTSLRGLLVRVSEQRFAIPLNAVEYLMEVKKGEVRPLEGYETVRRGGHPIRLVWLGDVLGLAGGEDGKEKDRFPVVILRAGERCMAFAVDELEGEQEVVIKGLGKQLSRVGGVAGATTMGSGEVVLILNVADLIKLAVGGERRPVFEGVGEGGAEEKERVRQRILVVDDSITTRTLEKNILEAAGYRVELATDGQEALEAIAREGVPDLIVSDIAMPRMNGFELTRRVKGDAETAEVPVILVTSLDSPEDKVRGIEAGADAYIVKSSFDQSNLLETIEQLI